MGSESNPELPGEIALEPAYPNPFNPSTTIRFSLPLSAHATLTVFNAQGQKVVVLVDDQVSAGSHAVVFDAKGLSSGAYFARLTVGNRSTTRPLLLAK